MEESSSSSGDEDAEEEEEEEEEEDIVLNTNRNGSNSSSQQTQTSDTSDSEEMLTLVSSSLISTKREQNATDNSQIHKPTVVNQSNGFAFGNEVHKDDKSQMKSENNEPHEISQRRKRIPHTRSHKKQRTTKNPKIEEINKNQ
jgi:hypothetical protein